MSLILFLIIIVMGIMWHCEPNMMRDMVAKSKIVLEKAKVLKKKNSSFSMNGQQKLFKNITKSIDSIDNTPISVVEKLISNFDR